MTQIDVIAVEILAKLIDNPELLLEVALTDEDMEERLGGGFIKDAGEYYILPDNVDAPNKTYDFANYYNLLAKRSYQLANEMMHVGQKYNDDIRTTNKESKV